MGLYINSILFRISGTLHFIYINLVKMREREREESIPVNYVEREGGMVMKQ